MEVKLIDNMGTATVTGSTVTTTGAKAADFMYAATDLISTAGVASSQDNDCIVYQNSPTGMSALVSTGTVYVQNSDYAKGTDQPRYYIVDIDSVQTATIAGNSSGSTRYDIVCVKVDTALSPNSEATNIASIVTVTGASGGSAPATPNNYYKLATVQVTNGASSIVTADITDNRKSIYIGGNHLALQHGTFQNGKVVRTIATNAITVAIKTRSGDDPSRSNPVYVTIENDTYAITAALSITLASGTPWMNLNKTASVGQSIDLFVGLHVVSGVVQINLSLWPDSPTGTYADYSSTNTDQKYLAYSGSAPSSTARIAKIDRVSASLNASNQWSIGSVDEVYGGYVVHSRELTHVGTLSGNGSMTIGTITYNTRKYRIIGNRFECYSDVTCTPGGTLNSQVIMAAPLSSFGGAFFGSGYNSAAGFLGGIQATSSDTLLFVKAAGSNYTNAATDLTGNVVARGI